MQVGDEFERLEVVEVLKGPKIRVKCVCGTIKDVYKQNLKSGATRSCGCLQAETASLTLKSYHVKKAEA